MSATQAIGFLILGGAGLGYMHNAKAGAAAQPAATVQLASYSPPAQTNRLGNLVQGAFDLFSSLAKIGGAGAAPAGGGAAQPPSGGPTPSAPSGGSPTVLLALLRRAEGAGYNTPYGGSRLLPPQPLSTMTVAAVRQWQSQTVAAGSASNAAGAYQIIGSTMDELIGNGVLHPGELFNSAAQDRAALYLLQQDGLASYQGGALNASQFVDRIARTWASIPVATAQQGAHTWLQPGQSYYAKDGLNAARVSLQDALNAVQMA